MLEVIDLSPESLRDLLKNTLVRMMGPGLELGASGSQPWLKATCGPNPELSHCHGVAEPLITETYNIHYLENMCGPGRELKESTSFSTLECSSEMRWLWGAPALSTWETLERTQI